MSDTTVITVAGEQPYDISVGRGILPLIAAALPPAATKVLVVHPPTLAAAAAQLREELMASGERQVLLAEIPDAEAGKRVEVAAFCWQVMGQADFTRTDAVVGFGGGAVTDVAGFVADFHDVHEEILGIRDDGSPVEVGSWGARVRVPLERAEGVLDELLDRRACGRRAAGQVRARKTALTARQCAGMPPVPC